MLNNHYNVIDTLHENVSTVVYRAQKTGSTESVIIKMLKPGEITEHQIAQLMNEQRVLSLLRSFRIIRLIDVVATPSEYFHVFEDIGGSSLHDLLLTRRFSLAEGLDIALKIAEALRYLHYKHIIHADINPKNVIYNPETKALQIIDFGYSLIDNHFRYNSEYDVGTSGNLMYMSPEQTGRTKQKIDRRSDFYSFGMTLYHLFSGRSPFEAKDRFELIHKQIALHPARLEQLVPGFPPVLMDIIEHLIEKKPPKRYQSDEAIIFDIKNALHHLTSSDGIVPFAVATRDRPPMLIGERLFGRSREVALLKKAAHSIAAGSPVHLLVSGRPGIGKSRLVEEFLTYMNTGENRIIRGKFDEYKSAQPYLTFRQMFAQLATALLRQRGGEGIIRMKEQSARALGSLFPELRDIVPYKHAAKTGGDLHQHLPYAVEELFRQAATAKAPLILFMDDLQWADPASVELIDKTILRSEIPHLHLVLSCRDNEIGSNPKAEELIRKIREGEKFSPYIFDLAPLGEADLEEMVAAVLGESVSHIVPLAMVIYRKTLGNPFYVKTFVEGLIDAEKLTYLNGTWRYEVEKVQSYGANIDVAALIGTRYAQLENEEKGCLNCLALLGSRFNLALSSEVLALLNLSGEQIAALEAKGFIELYGDEYRFVHDIVRHHVVDDMDPEMRGRLHAKIGRVLGAAYEEGRYDDVVGVVSHLNYGVRVKEKWLFGLNMKALEQMLQGGSYAAALKHLHWMEQQGAETLFAASHTGTFAYGMAKTKTLYLNAMHDEARLSIRRLIALCRNISEKTASFSLYKDLCVTSGKGFEELVGFGNALFAELGLQAPGSPEETAFAVARLRDFVDKHPLTQEPETIIRLRTSRNLSKERIVSMLVQYWEAAYYLADIELMEWAYMSIVEHSFRYGNMEGTPFGYVLYGARMVSEHCFKRGYRFGEAALKLNHRFGDETMLPKVYNFMANFISPYTRGIEENLPLYRKSLHQSKVNGDIVFGTWANFLMHLSDYLAGKSLETLRNDILRESSFLLNSGDKKMIAIFEVLRHIVEEWQGKSDPIDEESHIALWEAERFYPGLAWYGILKAQNCLIDGDAEGGLGYLERYVRTSANEVIMFPKLRLHPLRALLLLGKNSPLNPSEEEMLRSDLAECDAYAKASPSQFRFWKLLLRAESAKKGSRYWDVAKHYDEALREARKSAAPFHIAVAGLCAGRYWKGLKFDDMSRFYFSEASVGLGQWGAYEAANRFRSQTPLPSVSVPKEGDDSSSSSLLKAEPTNYRSLLKAFYALTQVMEKKKLLQTLMKIILENATASKAVLVLEDGGDFHTVAGIHFESGEIELINLPLAETPFLPYHLINHTITTRHRVHVNDPSRSGKFQYDDYFREHSPASCMAIPASVEGSVRGILYLENEEVVTPLDHDTIQTLRLLLAQAAIVYRKNALYETLKTNEELLSKAQKISHVGSWHYDNATGKMAWSEETYRIYELDPSSGMPEGEWMLNFVHPDDAEKVMQVKEVVMGGQPFCEVVNRIITARGNTRIVRQRAEAYWENDYQKLSGTIQDITESKRAEEMIDRLSQVVRQTPFSTIITDKNGVIDYVNNQTLKMTGYFRHELVEQKMSLFSSGCHPKEFYADLWETITVKRSIWRGTIVNRMKNGTLCDCASTIFPVFDAQNEIASFVTIQEDITERNMKDKLFLMQTRQAQMGEMLSMIAHQWRQPLAIMSALMNRQKINILLEQSTMEEVSRSFSEIETQIQHLSRTITDFKDFFRPDKQTVLTRSSVIVSKALDLIEHSLMIKNIRLEKVHLHDEEYMSYENELVQVLLNLIKNAQDAFEERKVKEAHLLLRTDTRGGEVIITVEDNAGGIPPEIIDTLFAPYVSTKTEHQGTGLGLYMSKMIVEEHCHGNIGVENTPVGARFIVRFPVHLLPLP